MALRPTAAPSAPAVSVRAGSCCPPWSRTSRPPPASAARKSSARWSRSPPSTPTTKRSLRPTTPATACTPWSSPRTCPARTAPPPPLRPAPCGSTASSSGTCAPPSAASATPASAAKAATSAASSSPNPKPSSCRSERGRLRLAGLAGRRLAAGREQDVDAERTRLVDHPPHDPAAVGDVPPAARYRPEHDLGDLFVPREADDGPGRIVVFQLMPAGTEIGGQLPQS